MPDFSALTTTPGGIPASDWALAQKYGKQYGVDPLLLVAIGFHETQWGKLGDGRNGNILGVGSFDSGSSYQWTGVENQLRQGAKILAAHGVHTIADVRAGRAHWWATDPAWKDGVSSWFDKITKGFKDTFGGGSAGGGIGGLVGSVLSLPKQLTDFLSALEKPVQGLMWFVDPTHWARIIAGVFGFLLLGAGLVALGKAA